MIAIQVLDMRPCTTGKLADGLVMDGKAARGLRSSTALAPHKMASLSLVAEVSAFAPENAKPGETDVEFSFSADVPSSTSARPLPRPPINRADKVSLNNPLKRLERMGCGWIGVIMEWDGVIVDEDTSLDQQVWSALAEEEGKPRPLAFVLKKAHGMKNEHAISEVFCWTRDPVKLRHLSRRKEEIFEEMHNDSAKVRPGTREFIQTLMKYKIPIAVASTRPAMSLEKAIKAVGLESVFEVVISAEDVYRGKPDPEMFLYAAEKLGFIHERCIVVGNSNKTIEAAHDATMKVVAVGGTHPLYELSAADLVVRRLDELSVVDLKNLADIDSPEFAPMESEEFLEVEQERKSVLVDTLDGPR